MAAEPIKPVFSARVLDWMGDAILYVLLVVIPFLAARWMGEVLPLVLQPVGRIVANAMILPFLYLCLHFLLRAFGLPCRNFIALVVLIFGAITYMEVQRALRTGDYNAWVSAVVTGVYVLVFAALTIQSLLAGRRERNARREAEEKEEAERQAKAFSRARQVGP